MIKQETIDYLTIPDIIKEMIANFTEGIGIPPTAIYIGRITRRHLAFGLANQLNKVIMKPDRDYYEGLPIYIVDCENYIAVS